MTEFETEVLKIIDERLADLANAVDGRRGDDPGVLEGGFMRLFDRLDDNNRLLSHLVDAVEKIADAKSRS